MNRPPFIAIDGKAYRWKDLLELRKAQRAATRANQLTLFHDLKADSRPASERTAAGRFSEPNLFDHALRGHHD